MKRSRKRVLLVVAALLVAGVGALIAMKRPASVAKGDDIPLATVTRGDIDLEVHATGELSTTHAVMLTAPPIGGDSLQITQLARTGEYVKKGDMVVEFDPSEQHFKLEQSRSELLQAEQEITKAKADAAVLVAEDKVALLKAKYAVRSAELDMEKNELLSKIDAEKNELELQQAKRSLAELEKDIESHHANGQASIFLAQEKHNKARLGMDQAQQNLDRMRITATIDGLVSIQKNMNASGGFYYTGMSVPDFRPGDQVSPGASIAQVLDPSDMTLKAKVPEQDHENIRQGEPVQVVFDAFPGTVFHGAVKTMAGMSAQSWFGDDSNHGFDVTIQLDGKDARLRPGLSAQIAFLGERRAGVLYVPRQALFMKDGKRVVFLRKRGSYEQREVKVECQDESRAAIAGLEQGSEVALLDPTVPHTQAAGASSATGGTP
jgi:HlyD family secretion protein